ncbi:MAG: hypothetical protein J3Q66DRAFT_439519 [Benniella sp.]|nr:MAG: hypothetical protein J3Q66DRAFT_439519 [Benniella sp.]
MTETLTTSLLEHAQLPHLDVGFIGAVSMPSPYNWTYFSSTTAESAIMDCIGTVVLKAERRLRNFNMKTRSNARLHLMHDYVEFWKRITGASHGQCLPPVKEGDKYAQEAKVAAIFSMETLPTIPRPKGIGISPYFREVCSYSTPPYFVDLLDKGDLRKYESTMELATPIPPK